MKRTLYITLVFLMLLPWLAGSQSIVNTVHNLSVTGPGQIKASSESEICVFCHTPHTAKARSPLWNRQDPGLTYMLYNQSSSSTLDAMPGQPDGSSLLCLSCHDGTIAMGNVLSRPREISFTRGVSYMPQGKSNLGRDLSNDHPVSFEYTSALSALDPELKDPGTLVGPVRLEQGKMQCTSCHDPHKNLHGDFLVASTKNSNLCMHCHQVNYWNVSTHRTSNATWNGSGQNPWPHTGYKTVAANGCENCHSPHHAGGKAQLVNYQSEEMNCLNCHNGSVAASGKNIQAEMSKTFRHDVMAYTGIHDASEPGIPAMRHVECADCHNPHASNAAQASAPAVKGSLVGVKGINSNGMPVESAQYEYEICARCHSSNPVVGPSTPRQVVQANTLLEFAANSISFHPVQTQGKNSNVPGLISPMTVNSMLYCSDCHASNGTDAPGGPHGSIYPQILKAQYVKTDGTMESAAAYALCYTCHARTEYTQNSGDNVQRIIHYKHVVEQKTSCNTCHDAHGISAAQGIAIRNTHLINFNTSVVSPLAGTMYFQDNGNRSGLCNLKCHSKEHQSLTY